MQYAKNTETILSRGPFAQIIGARAICADGKVRKVRGIGQDRDYGTRTGNIKVKGRTVSGFICFSQDFTPPAGACEFVEFVAAGKNAGLLVAER